jgi:hypothetical protein
MSYYLEIWLRGYAKDKIIEVSNVNEEFHPHITLIRPFTKINTSESVLKSKISNFCQGQELIFFNLEGINTFKEDLVYANLTNQEELLSFNYLLEELLKPDVEFKEKLNERKILHAYIGGKNKTINFPNIEQYMLRLTAIKDKRIWFSYDFITDKTLDREESLDKIKWYSTVHEFSKKYKLLPTRQGYQEITD